MESKIKRIKKLIHECQSSNKQQNGIKEEVIIFPF